MIFFDPKSKRKKYVRIFFVTAAAAVLGLLLATTFDLFMLMNQRPDPPNFDPYAFYKFYQTPVNHKKVALTFDDGPDPEYTLKIASILEKHGVPGTFFFTGSNVLRYPWITKEISERGFEIGNHSFTHSRKVHDSPNRLEKELRTTSKIIELVTGERPLYYRPPFLFNIGSDATLNPYIPLQEPMLISFREGFLPVGADIESLDWHVTSAEELRSNVEKEISTGHIFLMHDTDYSGGMYAFETIEDIIVKYKALGYNFVSLNELLIPPSPIMISRTLALGSEDSESQSDVALLQWFLHTQGLLYESDITGQFNKETEDALKNWQYLSGIHSREYGALGEETARSIAAATTGGFSREKVVPAAESLSKFRILLQRNSLFLASFGAFIFQPLFFVAILLVVSRILVILILYLVSVIKRRIGTSGSRERYAGGVSILIPAYNEEENIASSIYSVISNDYPDKEIIVINDGSKDKTSQVVKEIQSKYPNLVKLIDKANGGKSKALNIGIKHAKYDILISMDADTVFAKDTVRHLAGHFSDPKVGAVAGKVETTKTTNMLDIFQSIEYIVGQNIEKKILSTVNGVGVIPGPVGAYRKSIVKKVGGYSMETLVEDQDLTLAINTAGYKIIYDPKAVAYTETPHTLKDFLAQRMRWIYGTIQCVWKYRGFVLKKPLSSFSLIIFPNTIVFNIALPLMYPFIDVALILSLVFDSWREMLIVYAGFTFVDMIYAAFAFVGEKGERKKLLYIPLQRIYYRQIIYYVVAKSMLKAVEGTGTLWNKVIKRGESQKFYLANLTDLKEAAKN